MFRKIAIMLSGILLVTGVLVNGSHAKRMFMKRTVVEQYRHPFQYSRHKAQREHIRKTLGEVFRPDKPWDFRRLDPQQQNEWRSTLSQFSESPLNEQTRLNNNPQSSYSPRLTRDVRHKGKQKPRYSSLSPDEQKMLMVDLKQAHSSPSYTILTTPHDIGGKRVIHVYDKDGGYLIDRKFNILSNNRWVNLLTEKAGQSSNATSYLDFINNNNKTELVATDPGVDINLIMVSTSAEALAGLKEFNSETKRYAELLPHEKQVGLIDSKSFDDVQVVGIYDINRKPLFRIVPDGDNATNLIGSEVRNRDSLFTKEWFVHDTGLARRGQVQDQLPYSNIFFTKDIMRGLRNRQVLNDQNLKISKSKIRMLNFLPADRLQANKAGLKWDSEQVRQIKKRVWPLISSNLEESQILTYEMNRTVGRFRFLRKPKHQGFSKNEIINRWTQGQSDKTVDIIISIGHGTKGYLHMPSGDKISIADIQSLPEDALKNKLIIDMVCHGGEEVGKYSRADVFLEKGALGVLAPDSQIPVSDAVKALENCFKKLVDHKELQINEVIQLFKNTIDLHERVEIDPVFIKPNPMPFSIC